MEKNYHDPVLREEILEGLKVEKDKKYIDCTLGDGGHTIDILEKGGKVLGIDLDEGSLKRSGERITKKGFDESFTGVHGNFTDIENLAKQNGFDQADGILFDLGYSSNQLLDSKIGLSFNKDQPLDMRIDKSLSVTAADLVNALPESKLEELFSKYGGERLSKKFARAIVKARSLKQLKSTKDLVDIIVDVAPPNYENGRLHSATRVFQALRIVVNNELENLETTLPKAARLLLPGGRMAIISFHSLEDRIVKRFENGVLPVGKAPIKASKSEVQGNPRSRSAKLRIFEKKR